MDKGYILENAKRDIRELIEEMDLQNIDKVEGEISNYFDFLRGLTSLRSSKMNADATRKEVECLEAPIKKEAPTENNEDEFEPMYIFERKLRGGVVPEIEGYIPESVVRNLGLEHGDFVYAEEIKTKDPTSKRFKYSFAKMGERNNLNNRIEINYAIVTKVAGSLAVECYFDGSEKKSIKLDGVPYTIILNEADVNYLNIKEGAVIDLAFTEGMPDKHQVLWVHEDVAEETSTIETKTKLYRFNSNKDEEMREQEETEKTLIGKTILVVGNEPKKALYKKAIELRGGEFMWADAKDKIESFKTKIKKSDQVIFLLKVSAHVGMEHIKSICKHYDVPFDTTWSMGTSTVTRMAESV